MKQCEKCGNTYQGSICPCMKLESETNNEPTDNTYVRTTMLKALGRYNYPTNAELPLEDLEKLVQAKILRNSNTISFILKFTFVISLVCGLLYLIMR